jgi:hypothetical protein
LIDQTSLIYCAGVLSEADAHAAFRRVAAELRTRIGFLLARIGE